MGRRMGIARLGLAAALVLLVSSCGGGGGSSRSGGDSPQTGQSPTSVPTVPGQPSVTPTALPVCANQWTESSAAGAITLCLQNVSLTTGDSTAFSVFLRDSQGRPVAGQAVAITTNLTVLSPGSVGISGVDGSFSGSALAPAVGVFPLTVGVTDPTSPLNGLSVTLTVFVGPALTPTSTLTSTPTVTNTPTVTSTPTITLTPTSTPTGIPTPTPTITFTPTVTVTPEPCQDVKTIILQTDTPNVSSQTGGSAKITAVVFDSNNIRVAHVAVLFDVQPRSEASFSQLVQTTDANGTAMTTLNILPGSAFGTLAVSGQACGETGSVSVNVVSGVSTKPVKTVVLQADPSTVGNLSGGTINLSAAVFDADNSPIDGIDVLFVTPVGHVSPLTDRTKVTGSQSGIARSVLQVPVGTPENPYPINAVAEGVAGSTTVTVVSGRVLPGGINPGVPPGEPAAITLGASPTHMQVAGTGGTELATVIGRVFDNNGNPLSGVNVHYHVVAAESAAGAAILPVTTPVPTSSPTPVPTTLCPADDPVSVSDVAGFAVIQVHAGQAPGPVTVAACADTSIDGVPSPLIEKHAVVTISSGPASYIAVSISPVFSTNNDGTLLTMLSASVADAQGNPVEDGTGVFLTVLTSGPDDQAHNVVLSGSTLTNAEPPCDTSEYVLQTKLAISPEPGNAIACVKYPVALQATEIQVQATVGSVDNHGGQAVTLPGLIGDLEVRVVPATVLVNNADDAPALVRASVSDANMNPIENVRIHFTTSIGTIDQSVLTDSNGQASATLVIPAGTQSGTAILRVGGGGLLISNITVPILNIAATTTPTPGTPTPVTQPGAMQFLGADPPTIGVRGSGLPEQSVLTFQVTDAAGDPVSGVTVGFSIARIADEQISPLQAVTDGAGKVQVTLTSGKRAMSLQVTAEVDSVSPPLIVRSAAVSILGGPPSQPNFSVVHKLANVSGGVYYGTLDTITAFVADRFGNPVPPGTTVDFTTKGGAIGNPTTTSDLGQATATLVTQAPVPANGIVVTLATTSGERPFIDVNGNGVCDDGDQLLTIPEPFYDANCNGTYDPGEDFIDLNGNGKWDSDQGSGTPACGDQVVVFNNVCTTFSGPTSVWLIPDGTGPIEPGGSRNYTLIVSDNPNPIGNPGVGNPIVGGSQLSVKTDGSRARVIGLSNFTLADAMTFDRLIDGINRFHFSVLDNAPDATKSEVDVVTVTVTSDVNSLPGGGNGSVTVFDALTFLAAPTPTPTITTTFTPTVTPTQVSSPTATPQPPMIAPTQATLAAGSGAPPNGCNGATQTFVVTGGSPPFNVFAGGGCVSVSSVPTSGGSFIFTSGNVLGNFTVTVTDAAGKTASAGVTVQGPPTPTFTNTPLPTNTPPPSATVPATATVPPTPGAAYVRLDQILSHVTNNQDGTFTTIVSALVTDVSGVVVGDGVPVTFTLVDPVSGVSLTSPGYTGQAQPCTIDFAIVLQPGDALSCLKYVAALQGTTVTVQASVQTATGGFVTDERQIILIDTRPTATPTITSTPTVLPSPTPTVQPPSIAPSGATLWAGVEPPPNCNGIAQTFVVSGGAPPFTISAGGVGCLSTAVVQASGGSFTFIAGNEVGTFLITATDALGRIATAGVTQQGPPAAFIDVDLIENQRVDNGDGTFSSVLSALVTDASGRTIPDGVPVEFSLVDPVSGVSITSPGFTNQAQPCTIAFTVTPQPGDALACIKYVYSRQGTTITIRARVTTATGAVIEADKTVTLPDTRPTATATMTATLPPTNTPTITATPSPWPSGVATFTPAATPSMTPTPPAGSIQFLGATPSYIGVRGSGLPEQSTLVFKVNSTTNTPMSGVAVQFTLSGSGSESLNPLSAVSDQNGLVSTAVTSGIQATTVRVVATVVTNPGISAQSTAVSILGAPPAYNHFSIAAKQLNIQGRVTFGLSDVISVYVNDRFGNAVPPGTAVSLVTNAASVVNPTTTDASGVATATLLTEGVVPPSGIVTVMAYTHGEESFLDNNGDGIFDAGDTILTDDIPEPFIDFRPYPPGDIGCSVSAPSWLCNNRFDVNTPFELFVDTNGNGVWDSVGTTGIGQGTHNVWDNNIMVWRTFPVTFSGPTQAPILETCLPGPCSGFHLKPGQSMSFTIDVHDDLVNPLVGGSTIAITASAGTVTGGSIAVPDGESFNQLVDGLTRFSFLLSADPTLANTTPTTISVSVTSPNGNLISLLTSGIVGP